MDSEEMVCEQCSAKLTGEEGMMICLPCQDGENDEDSSDYPEQKPYEGNARCPF
jgi:hypothetical protein